MDFRNIFEQYGRAIAVALIVIVAIVGISLASNNTDQPENEPKDITTETSDVPGNDATDDNSESDRNTSGDSEADRSEDTNDQGDTGDLSESAAGPVEVESTEDGYSATARSGDNQTVMVRQIVADYASSESINLNASQKLYAETILVNELGRNDAIEVGYDAELSKDTVSNVIEDAGELSQAEQDLWAQYL